MLQKCENLLHYSHNFFFQQKNDSVFENVVGIYLKSYRFNNVVRTNDALNNRHQVRLNWSSQLHKRSCRHFISGTLAVLYTYSENQVAILGHGFRTDSHKPFSVCEVSWLLVVGYAAGYQA